MDRSVFYEEVRESLFSGRLSQSQVDGMERLLNYAETHGIRHVDLAYILATSFHETGQRMVPVREGFASSDAAAIKAVTKLFNKGRIKKNYALPHPKTGKSYYGRGDVQLTWYDNYLRMSKITGLDLVNNPDLALDLKASSVILFKGMLEGHFTGKKLSDFLKEGVSIQQRAMNFDAARRVVNGTDKAVTIGGYAEKFYQALSKADYVVRQGIVLIPKPKPEVAVVPEEDAAVDNSWNWERIAKDIATHVDWADVANRVIKFILSKVFK